MPDRPSQILFPAAGIVRGAAYQAQPPFSTPDAENVWPYDSLEDRARGGSRPGLETSKFWNYSPNSTPGNPVQSPAKAATPIQAILATNQIMEWSSLDTYDVYRLFGASPAEDDTHKGYFETWTDHFDAVTFGSVYSSAWGETGSLLTPILKDSFAYAPNVGVGSSWYGGMLLGANRIPCFRNKAIVAQIYVVPWRGEHNGTYRLYLAQTDNSMAPATDGVKLEVSVTSAGVLTGTIEIHSSEGADPSAYTLTQRTIGVRPFVLTLVNKPSTAELFGAMAFVNGELLGSIDHDSSYYTGATGTSYRGAGFAMKAAGSDTTKYPRVDYFRLGYVSNPSVVSTLTKSARRTRPVIGYIQTGQPFAEEVLDDVQYVDNGELTTQPTCANGVPLEHAVIGNEVFIADHEPPIVDGNVVLAEDSAVIKKITHYDISAKLGGVADLETYVLVIHSSHVNGLPATTEGSYEILSVSGDTITFAVPTSSELIEGQSVHFRIERLPKMFVPNVASQFLTLAAAKDPQKVGIRPAYPTDEFGEVIRNGIDNKYGPWNVPDELPTDLQLRRQSGPGGAALRPERLLRLAGGPPAVLGLRQRGDGPDGGVRGGDCG
jgi:hypothetical protein